MSEKGGRKYRLLLYEHILDRWWPATLTLSFLILLNVGVLWGAEYYFAPPEQDPLPKLSTQGGGIMIAIGILALLFTFFLLVIRRMAYVQLFQHYMRLSTPFFRVNISYKRIHHTITAETAALFPLTKYRGWKREIIQPLAGYTAIIIHLTAYPLPRPTLGIFLSPFFFYDKTPHFVLILENWMNFNIELESRRSETKTPRQSRPRITSGLLDDLNQK